MKRNGLKQILINAIAMALVAVTIFPFLIMLLMAAKDSAQLYARFWAFPNPIRWENFAFGAFVTYRYILNSVTVSAFVCLGTIVCGMFAAYAFSVLRFPGRKLLYASTISLMMVPGILMLVPLFLTVRTLGLLNSYTGLILPQIAGGIAMAVFFFRNYFDTVPKDLFDSARIDGAREWQILLHVVFPLSLPIISTVAVVNILGSWNNYIWPLLVVRDASLRTPSLSASPSRRPSSTSASTMAR